MISKIDNKKQQIREIRNVVKDFQRKYYDRMDDEAYYGDEIEYELVSLMMHDLLDNKGKKEDIRMIAFWYAFQYDKYNKKFEDIADTPRKFKELKKDYSDLVDRFNLLLEANRTLIQNEQHTRIKTNREILPF